MVAGADLGPVGVPSGPRDGLEQVPAVLQQRMLRADAGPVLLDEDEFAVHLAGEVGEPLSIIVCSASSFSPLL